MIRSKRKTLVLFIAEDGTPEVRAPLHCPFALIEKFVEQKSDWIIQHAAAAHAHQAAKKAFSIGEGSTLLYLGKAYPVVCHPVDQADFDGTRFIVPVGNFESIRPSIIALYRQLAASVISDRVEFFSSVMGVRPASVKITGAVTRWGSCSGKNRLCFSWMLMMASSQAVDYVVVHELAHILHHDHSTRFWAAVASVLPDYAQRKQLLSSLQKKLMCENWTD